MKDEILLAISTFALFAFSTALVLAGGEELLFFLFLLALAVIKTFPIKSSPPAHGG